MTTLEAMIAAVIANPECDTARLVAADAFEEDGQIARAEFVRVQVELSKMPPKPRELFGAVGSVNRMKRFGIPLIPEGGGYYSALSLERGLSNETFLPNERVDIYAEVAGKGVRWVRGLKYVHHVDDRHVVIFRKDDQSGPWVGNKLADRERKLFNQNLCHWMHGSVTPNAAYRLPYDNHDELPIESVRMMFTRGFVSSIHTTLATFLRCAGEFAKVCPLEAVHLTDRRPENVLRSITATIGGEFESKPWTYFIGNGISESSPTHLPQDIWYYMPGSWYATEQDAKNALSQACVRYAKKQAGQV